MENDKTKKEMEAFLGRPLTDAQMTAIMNVDLTMEELSLAIGWGGARRIKALHQIARREGEGGQS